MTSKTTDNLAMPGDAASSAVGAARPAPNERSVTSLRWAGFQLTASDVMEFRDALRRDRGDDGRWTDDDIREMAYNSIALVSLIRRIQRAHPSEERRPDA